MRINPLKVGFAFGFLLAVWHACWALLVAMGWAQPVLDFILWAHFLKLTVQVQPFDTHQASLLVGATAILGFLMGVIIALAWNALHPRKG
jgi:hypothetical protein